MDVWLTALSGVVGVLVGAGAVLAFQLSEHEQRRPAEGELPASTLPAGVADVLAVLRSSGVVVDAEDRVVRASPAALSMGLVRADRLVSDTLLDLVQRTRRDGEIREERLELPRGPMGNATVLVLARVAPLSSSLVLLLVEDHTEARRVEEVRRDFLANISHELKTPVGAMALLAEALLDAADDPVAVRRFAGRIQHESQRLSRLVQDVIELSRLQGHDPLLAPALVPLDDVVAEAVDRSRATADARRINLVCGGRRGVMVRGDARQLVTALGNLVDNAVRYGPEGTRVVISTAAQRLRPGRGRRAERHRRGARHRRGRARPDLRAVLPGRRRPVPGDRGDRPRPVHRQARRRRARWRGHRLERRGHRLHLHPAAAGRVRLRGECVTRILVVEDEESFRDALSYMLRKEGFEVVLAETGPSALEEFDRHGADLVLLDLMLPGLSGTEVCRASARSRRCRSIMLTAKDSEVDKVVGLELGADDYVTKPYSTRELLARIRAVLRRRGEPEDLAPATVEAGPVRLDVDRHVVSVSGEEVTMPLKEFELLELLLRNAGRVLTRGQLIDRVWGSDYVGDTKTLDVHVKRLRAKVEPDAEHAAAHRHRARSGLQVRALTDVSYSRGRRGSRSASRWVRASGWATATGSATRTRRRPGPRPCAACTGSARAKRTSARSPDRGPWRARRRWRSCPRRRRVSDPPAGSRVSPSTATDAGGRRDAGDPVVLGAAVDHRHADQRPRRRPRQRRPVR